MPARTWGVALSCALAAAASVGVTAWSVRPRYLGWDRSAGVALRERRDWAFVQSVGGLALGTPVRTAAGVMLPVAVDVSGLRAITTKPTALHSGLALDAIRVRRDGGALELTLWTTLAGRGRVATSPDLALGALEAGRYAVVYVEPDGRRVSLGEIVVP